MIAKRFLCNLGHRDVTHVEDGQAAVEALATGDFDLVLMDCQMPVMDGFEATKRIRSLSDDSKRSVPIVALTASALKADVDRCMAAGMDDHLSKPYDCRALSSKLVRWLRTGDAAGPGRQRCAACSVCKP
jgi:CheY-like chemotaxis protein